MWGWDCTTNIGDGRQFLTKHKVENCIKGEVYAKMGVLQAIVGENKIEEHQIFKIKRHVAIKNFFSMGNLWVIDLQQCKLWWHAYDGQYHHH